MVEESDGSSGLDTAENTNPADSRPPIPKQGYLVERNGLSVVRQLTPEELGLHTPEVEVSQEEFKIHGVNDTSLIRSLTSLRGVPLETIEEKMRPGSASAGGFIGKDESLRQVLAKDNETVLDMGLTHQQLAEFLDYFSKAEKVGYENPRSHKNPGMFEFNDRKYAFFAEYHRGGVDSPFGDGSSSDTVYHLICLEDGNYIGYSKLHPEMIHRYGFYEGEGAAYRLEPKKVAETAGFVPMPADDPVAKLVQDNDAQSKIKSADHLHRMYNLISFGVDVASGKNFRIAPEDSKTLFTFLDVFGKDFPDVYAHLNTENTKQNQYLVGYKNFDTLVRVLPKDFPSIRNSVLDTISSIAFEKYETGENEANLFFKEILAAVAAEAGKETHENRTDYFTRLLKKIEFTPETVQFIYDEASSIAREDLRDKKKGDVSEGSKIQAIATVLEEAAPTFREDIAENYGKSGVSVGDANLEELLMLKEDLDSRKEAVETCIRFAKEVGGRSDVNPENMGKLVETVFKISRDPEHVYSEDERAMSKAVGIDLDLVPFALEVSGELHEWPEHVIPHLYNGNAAELRDAKRRKEKSILGRLSGIFRKK